MWAEIETFITTNRIWLFIINYLKKSARYDFDIYGQIRRRQVVNFWWWFWCSRACLTSVQSSSCQRWAVFHAATSPSLSAWRQRPLQCSPAPWALVPRCPTVSWRQRAVAPRPSAWLCGPYCAQCCPLLLNDPTRHRHVGNHSSVSLKSIASSALLPFSRLFSPNIKLGLFICTTVFKKLSPFVWHNAQISS